MQVWLATAGYSYPEWVGAIYPPGTRGDQLLTAYAREFPLVEINSTYYRCPTAEQFARLLQAVPPGFQFSVKLPQTITHQRDPAELAPFAEAVSRLRANGQLFATVCQFPESFHNGPAQQRWLGQVVERLAEFSPVVEFRHRSWSKPAVNHWLTRSGAGVVSVDVPDLPQLYPRGLVVAGPLVYARLHSRVVENWYGPGMLRYDYDYPDAVLREWIEWLRAAARVAKRAAIVFNNCVGTQAVTNARRLRQLLAGEAADLPVVAPVTDPRPRQRFLFD